LDFAEQQRNPVKHLFSMTVVVVLHIIVVYALVTGLARKVVEVIKQPLETKIIEEIKDKPKDEPPPPPKLVTPPPPFVPPPEVQIQMPSTLSTSAISTVTNVRPVAAPVRAAPAPPPPPKPLVRKGAVPLHRVTPEFPRRALQDGIQGSVVAHLMVARDGTVKEVKIISSEPRGVFDREVIRAMMQWKFTPDDNDYIVEAPIEFKLTD
jgi:protein TonB